MTKKLAAEKTARKAAARSVLRENLLLEGFSYLAETPNCCGISLKLERDTTSPNTEAVFLELHTNGMTLTGTGEPRGETFYEVKDAYTLEALGLALIAVSKEAERRKMFDGVKWPRRV